MLVLEHSVPCGTKHVHTTPRLSLMSGAELSTAGQAMKRGQRVSRSSGSYYPARWHSRELGIVFTSARVCVCGQNYSKRHGQNFTKLDGEITWEGISR